MDSIILGLLSGLWAAIAMFGLSVWYELDFVPPEPPAPPEPDLEAQLIATGHELKVWPRPVEPPK